MSEDKVDAGKETGEEGESARERPAGTEGQVEGLSNDSMSEDDEEEMWSRRVVEEEESLDASVSFAESYPAAAMQV